MASELVRLQSLLRTPGLPGQKVIATAADVDQGLVSRARNGGLKRVTPRVMRLLKQVSSQVETLGQLAETMSESSLAKPLARAGSGQQHHAVRKQFERYLADGLDGHLLIQQLAVLRRAQRPRAGRPTKDRKRL